MNFILIVVPSLTLVVTMIYVWHQLLNKKINFKDYKLYTGILLFLSIAIINHFVVNSFIRVIIICFVSMLFLKFLLKPSIQKTIIIPILFEIAVMISEIFYSIIFVVLKLDINLLTYNLLFNMLSNIIVSIICILIFKLKITKKIYNSILKITDKISSVQLLIFCLLVIIIENILWANSYYKIDFIYMFIFNMMMFIIFFIIVLYSLRTKNNYIKVSDKYNVAIKSLNDYEEMMNKYKIKNHENKNLLLTVRAMILNKEKEIPKYIDSIVKDKFSDDEKLLFQMNSLPSGGLRATIYSKILKIREFNIKYNLLISKNIKSSDLIELEPSDTIDLCKIVSVFIDNAIEAVKDIENKNILISIYKEDNDLFINISNTFNNKIDIDKIYNPGYTTKGKNHGYGLSLVKHIIDNNKIFENKTEIVKEQFKQILIIKNK